MFLLAEIRDIVAVPARQINKISESIRSTLEFRFVGKVVHNCGLVVRVEKLIAIGDATVGGIEGSLYIPVLASVVCFRPFVGDVIEANVLAQSPTRGIQLSMEFFDHINVSRSELIQPSEFSVSKQQWMWKYTDDMGFCYIDGKRARFRVRAVRFDQQKRLMTIDGTMKAEGLGMKEWWDEDLAKTEMKKSGGSMENVEPPKPQQQTAL